MTNSDSYEPTVAEYDEACRLVGRFMNHWALLESGLNTAITKLLGMKVLEGTIVANNMQCRSKIHIIKTMINLIGARSQWLPGAIKNIDAIANMSDKRNTVVHVPFAPHSKGGVEFLPIKAKGKLTFPDMIWKKTDFNEHCNRIAELSNELDETVRQLSVTRSFFEFAASKGSPQGLETQNALLHLLQGRPDCQIPNPEEAPETPQEPHGQ